MQYEYVNGIGQDSHRFMQPCEAQLRTADKWPKKLKLGGVVFEGETPLVANSDGDAVLHALTNAISGVTGVNVLGYIADQMCKQGITDSAAYLAKSLDFAKQQGWELTHISFSLECKRPKITPMVGPMKERIGQLTGLNPMRIGITATSGENLTRFGEGEGIMVICSVTMRRDENAAPFEAPGAVNAANTPVALDSQAVTEVNAQATAEMNAPGALETSATTEIDALD